MGKGDPSRVGFLFGRLLDLVYPPSCGCCGVRLRDGRGLCDECGAGLPRLADPFCQRCGEPFEGEIDGVFDCPNCGKLLFVKKIKGRGEELSCLNQDCGFKVELLDDAPAPQEEEQDS